MWERSVTFPNYSIALVAAGRPAVQKGREAFVARVVLLVDDEPLVRTVAALMLEDLGCEVVTAADAADA